MVTHVYVTHVGSPFNATLAVTDTDGDVVVAWNLITVAQDLTPNAMFTASETSIYKGESIAFTHTGSNGNTPTSYSWRFGNGTEFATSENVTWRFTLVSSYTINLTIKDVDGDSNTFLLGITVSEDNDAPNITSPGRDAVRVFNQNVTAWCSVTDALSGIDVVELWYAVNTNVTFTRRVMSLQSGNNYTSDIRAQVYGSVVNYYYRAVDKAGNSAVLNNSGAYFTYALDQLVAGSYTISFTTPVSLVVTIVVNSTGKLELGTFDASSYVSGLNLANVLTSFDLGFTGNFSSMSIQCSYTGAVSTSRVRVHHWNGSTWVALTPSINTVVRTITFTVTSLSPFIVGITQETTKPGINLIQLILVLIGLGFVLGIAIAASARKKNVVKTKAKAPAGKKSKGKSSEYKDSIAESSANTTRGKLPVDQPAWVESTVVERKASAAETRSTSQGSRYYCQACIKHYSMPDAKEGERFSCPSCKKELVRTLTCTLCGKDFAVRQESAQRHEGTSIECPACHKQFLLSSKPALEIGEVINLFCPKCQAWSSKPAIKRVVGQEKCMQCNTTYNVMTQCPSCNTQGMIPVDKFSVFLANPSRCAKCKAILKVL
jgi:PKD repeat protein